MKLSLELKIKDKVIKLTEAEARELGETLATMFDLKKTEYIGYPWYPWRWRDSTWAVSNDTNSITCDNDYVTYNISDDISATFRVMDGT